MKIITDKLTGEITNIGTFDSVVAMSFDVHASRPGVAVKSCYACGLDLNRIGLIVVGFKGELAVPFHGSCIVSYEPSEMEPIIGPTDVLEPGIKFDGEVGA